MAKDRIALLDIKAGLEGDIDSLKQVAKNRPICLVNCPLTVV